MDSVWSTDKGSREGETALIKKMISSKCGDSFKKLEIELPYGPAISLLGIHTEEIRSERDTCTPMFIAALFTIARS